MAGTTPNLGLYLPGGGSTGTYTPDEVADIDPLNDNFEKIDAHAGTVDGRVTTLEGRNQQFTGLTAALGSVVGMKLGDEFQESDLLKRLWFYDGTAWVRQEPGKYIIRPTAATGTGVALSANGDVTLTTASGAITLSIPFSAKYDSYEIELHADAASTVLTATLQLRAATTTGNSNYYGSFEEVGNAVTRVKTDANNASTVTVGRIDVGGGEVWVKIFRPMKTVGGKIFQSFSMDSGGIHREGGYVCSHATIVANALSGVVITLSAGTITAGNIRIYGNAV